MAATPQPPTPMAVEPYLPYRAVFIGLIDSPTALTADGSMVTVVRFVRGSLVCLAASAVTFVPAAAQASEPRIADLAIESEPAHGPFDTSVGIPLTLHNYGPDVVQTGTSVIDVRLPAGTEFLPGQVPSTCTEIIPRRHRRCNSSSMIYPDDDNPSGVPGPQVFHLQVRIVAKCTSPGEYRIEYPHDPDLSNNSAPLVVTVDGVDPAACAPKSTPTPTATPKATPVEREAANGGGGAGEDTLPVTGAPTLPMMMVGAALLLVGVGLRWLGRRRGSTPPGSGGAQPPSTEG